MKMMQTSNQLKTALLAGLLVICLALTGCKDKAPQPVTEPPPPPAEANIDAGNELNTGEGATAGLAEGEQGTADKKDTESEKPVSSDKTQVRVLTERGEFTLELFDDKAPISAGNFLLLAESGYYNGVVFHRIEPGFCVQGGDPTGTGMGGPGFTIPDEVRADLRHDTGMLSMAKTAMPDTGGSQFFICLGGPEATGHLDMRHAVFGQVSSGMDVVKKLQIGDKMQKLVVKSLSPHADEARKKAEAARKPD